jgi:hypothetical protein
MFPQFEEIDSVIYTTILSRNPINIAKKSIFIRAISGADDGLILESNPNRNIFTSNIEDKLGTIAKGASIYGTNKSSGTVGINWNGKFKQPSVGRAGRPNPIITMLHITEGTDQISREANMNISCFSLEQLELIQKYFMEPGFSLFIEWGWNSTDGQLGLIKPNPNNTKGYITSTEILAAAKGRGLNNDTLKNIRKQCKGEYDCYFGFITGGSVKSENDIFNIEIKMQGVPSLPTYLQSHNQSFVINKKDGAVDSNNGVNLYPLTEVYGERAIGTDEDTLMKRRFKNMFNKLPSQRQTEEVKELMSSCKSGYFINFDDVVKNKITTASTLTWKKFFNLDFEEDIEAENGFVPKTSFTQSEAYIKFSLAMDILNSNGGLIYTSAGSDVSIKIDTSDTILPAFPNIFSTKKDKMVIPGFIPDFSKYFDNVQFVDQRDLYEKTWDNEGTYNIDTQTREAINSEKFIRFGQPKSIEETDDTIPYREEANYWGYLNDLYVNFDFFKNTISQSNKNIREILEDLLNGMSDAVNSFWNFQIIEAKSKTDGKLTFKIIDENWSGQLTSNTGIRKFQHSGMRSKFLEASLDMSIPADMANQIIARRNSIAVNANQPIIDANSDSNVSFFGGIKDAFLQVSTNTNNTLPTAEITAAPTPTAVTTSTEAGTTQPTTTQPTTNTAEQEEPDYYSENLEKLTILPKTDFISDDFNFPTNRAELNLSFNIYTFDDINLFDVIRNKTFYTYKKGTKSSNKRVSPLLPIKYSFKTYGISGLERGNIFHVDGIPKRYSNFGFFQITQYEQEISDSLWTTTVSGDFRQYQ